MRGIWALPAVLRIALASQHAFSVFDDLLAFPQYEVLWPDTFVTENEATSLLASGSPSPSSTTPGAQETQELSKRDKPVVNGKPIDNALEHTYEAVVLHGQRYLCSIPIIPEEVPQNDTTSAEEAKAEEERELIRATDRGWELLEGMRDNCIYYLSGWWSYRFCYKGEVKQFHSLPPGRGVPIYPPVEDESVHSFVLGRFSKEEKSKKADARKTLGNEQGSKEAFDDDEVDEKDTEANGLELPRLETKGSSRYMVQRLAHGTVCDLTGKPRKIDVQFHCNPQSADRISMVKETSTCSYLMIVDTPRLCNDVAFTPPQENFAHPIVCEPVVAESEVESWTAAQEAVQLAAAERLIAAENTGDDVNTNPLRDITKGLEGSTKRGPIIGGIEVGAKKLVGSEGKVIEKSLVVGGGKESFIIVASSDGKQMTKEEMKKHDIGNFKDVETFKNTLKKKAGKKGWKLVLADTLQGRELRGIIESDDEVSEKKNKKKKETSKDKEDESAGMGRERERERERERKQDAKQSEEEETYEGSEEVYKDEL